MSSSSNDFFQEYRDSLKRIKEVSPKTLEGFNGFYNHTMGDGVLNVKTKELIALGIGLAIHCENCIWLHARSAIKAGATSEEILEAAQVGVVMGGGPAFTYLPLLQKIIDQLNE
ncbi:MAG: carboxymuconolactone decarboxylase family protein [Candidatus Atribacteria bacterium]|nr:carboxymuconolactone decarboxylase family protein [Candidatus Atribacteria bacterium]